MMHAPEFYQQQVEALTISLKSLKKKKSVFAVLRLGSLLAFIGILYLLWSLSIWFLLAAVVVFLIVFIKLIHNDLNNKEHIERVQQLIKINKNELLALEDVYTQFPSGAAYQPKDHFYANDMDLFGPASVFQLLNRTSTEMGAAELAHWLLEPANISEIKLRQEAIKELKDKPIWRQKFQQIIAGTPIKNSTQNRLTIWLAEPAKILTFKPWAWLRYVLPAIILSISVLAIFDVVSMPVFYGALLIMAIVAYHLNKVIGPIHNQLSKMVNELEAFSDAIKHVEQECFKSEWMLQLKNNLNQQQGLASKKIKTLKNILERLDIRYNIVISFPLNIWLLWNLQQVIQLEKWKLAQQHQVHIWFEVLKKVEAIQSLACLHFNYPQWVMPSFKEDHFYLSATKLAHPLIQANKRVSNEINLNHAAEIMLITGSNMAGKSTYLRSVGVNVVLAMAGAPVCAETFTISPVQLMSSMRIADNLEESTSTFYAELKKLQLIIEKVNANQKVFILLDEILRGTNSLDRHTGSKALITQLIKKNAAAILATHDLELAKIKDDYPLNILNFHFDVKVHNEELFFDYKLTPGICTSMNASILMKKVGIEI